METPSKSRKQWTGEHVDFQRRVLLAGRPYFVVSCPCGCNRIDCKMSNDPQVAPVIVIPLANNTEGWLEKWSLLQ